MQGKLIKYVGGRGKVSLADGGVADAVLRGIFRKDGVTPIVGDNVTLDGDVITDIAERRNFLIRPPIANVDCMLLMLSQAPPRSDAFLADSLTVAAALQGITVIIAVNKMDLESGEYWHEHFANAGLKTFSISAKFRQGLAPLQDELRGKTIVLAGMSGVGKSTLLNALYPELSQATGEISDRLRLGKHTTRAVELLKTSDGTLVADTPGFAKFDLISEDDIIQCFAEMAALSTQCKYRGCRHIREEGCAILSAVNDGNIHRERHASYIKLVTADENDKKRLK